MKKVFLFSFLIIAIYLTSCQKNDTSNVTTSIIPTQQRPLNQVPQNDTDTSQNIFTISAITNPEPGIICVSPEWGTTHTNGMIMILNERGHVLKKKTVPTTATNFRRWDVNGKVRYSYEQYDLNGYIMSGIGYWPGYEIITDSNLNEIDRVKLQSYGTVTYTQDGIDGHDFVYIDDGHYIIESYYQKTVTNVPASIDTIANTKVVADIIQETMNGVVIWQWDGTDYPEFYSESLENNQFNNPNTVYDYLHLNSMFIDPRDNNLICSFRNLDEVVKLERGTGRIIWRLGGNSTDFGLNADQIFLRQHHVTLTDNNQTLLLFDDGLTIDRNFSRVLEFNLDESTHTVIGFKSFDIPEPFTQFEGSVQKRGNTYFIGGGTANYVAEINYETGEKLLELKSSSARYYRAYKY